MTGASLGRRLTWLGSLAATALTAHSLVNLRTLRTPEDDPAPVDERVSVLLPVRDEAATVAGCLRRVLDQIRVPDLEILVLDDGSTDGTADLVREVAGDDPRVRLLTGAPLPRGWLGKTHACQQLADQATGQVLVFLDADVRLAPHAVAAATGLLRSCGLDLISPWPRQLAVTAAERLVQPLLPWSWLTTLPLTLAERSARPSLSAANGQLIVVDAAAYRRVGGHAAVRDVVLDDIGLLRAVKRSGGHGVPVDGTRLAHCRMYPDWPHLREGYAKSLWSAFGSRAATTAVMGGLALCYLVPPIAALGGSGVGLAGYLAAVAGRYAVAERTGGRSLPDSFAHPVSIGLLLGLTSYSHWRHRQGTLAWRGRRIPEGAR